MMPKKIPTFVGLFLVLALVGLLAISTSGVKRLTQLFSQATGSFSPLTGPQVGNISDTTAVIYWTTSEEMAGSVSYGPTASLGKIALDSRNATDPNLKFATHFVNLTNLAPQTTYYYQLPPGMEQYSFTTGPTLSQVSSATPLRGKVFSADGSPQPDALVSFSASAASQIVALTKNDGSYVLPLGLARTPNLSAPAAFALTMPDKISIDFASAGAASIDCSLSVTALPDVKLGQTINCQSAKVSSQMARATFATASKSGTLEVNIVNGETVSSPLPTIEGQALPNQKVTITIHSDQAFSGTVVAGPDGSWSWTPPGNLSPGQHTVTITVQNPDGTTQEVTRTFNVPTESPILPVTSGTPSATPKHRACLSQTCSLVDGSGSDSCTTNADCTPPVQTHKECRNNACVSVSGTGQDQCSSNLSCQPAAVPNPPQTGSTGQTLALIVASALLVGVGLGTVLFTRL